MVASEVHVHRQYLYGLIEKAGGHNAVVLMSNWMDDHYEKLKTARAKELLEERYSAKIRKLARRYGISTLLKDHQADLDELMCRFPAVKK